MRLEEGTGGLKFPLVKVTRRQRFRLIESSCALEFRGWELGWYRANAQRKLQLGGDGCLLGGNQVESKVLHQ